MIGAYEVTNIQYERFVMDNGYKQRDLWSPEG